SGLYLALKAADRLKLGLMVLADNLQGHQAIQPLLAGPKDVAHATLSQPPQDLVAKDGRPIAAGVRARQPLPGRCGRRALRGGGSSLLVALGFGSRVGPWSGGLIPRRRIIAFARCGQAATSRMSPAQGGPDMRASGRRVRGAQGLRAAIIARGLGRFNSY